MKDWTSSPYWLTENFNEVVLHRVDGVEVVVQEAPPAINEVLTEIALEVSGGNGTLGENQSCVADHGCWKWWWVLQGLVLERLQRITLYLLFVAIDGQMHNDKQLNILVISCRSTIIYFTKILLLSYHS